MKWQNVSKIIAGTLAIAGIFEGYVERRYAPDVMLGASSLHYQEGLRTVPRPSERKESHSLTVWEVARLFESAGVARTERSIVNWCQPNRTDIARLDSYFDPNERKYYISPQSVDLAIEEEKAKAAKINDAEAVGKASQSEETFRTVPNVSESREIKELANEIRDLQITNKAKDIVIDQM